MYLQTEAALEYQVFIAGCTIYANIYAVSSISDGPSAVQAQREFDVIYKSVA